MNTLDNFSEGLSANWSLITDRVMGGVSTGNVALERANGETFLHLSGRVSTENNGGFIQARRTVERPLPEAAQGLELEMRGNGETYYVHLRGRGPSLPWQFHQAPFDANSNWRLVRLPFGTFRPRGMIVDRAISPTRIRSIAVVAYGRDHEVDLAVRRLGWY